MKGQELVNQAQESIRSIRQALNAQMEQAGYSYFVGGNYDCQWACWVHKDYTHLVDEGVEPSNYLMGMKIGLEELPEGAIVDVNYLG